MGGAAPAADADVDVPLAATDGDELCACPDEEEEQKVTIKFDELAEALQKLEEEIDPESIEEYGRQTASDSWADFYGVDKWKTPTVPKDAAAKKKKPDQPEEEEDLDEELDLSALVAAVMDQQPAKLGFA